MSKATMVKERNNYWHRVFPREKLIPLFIFVPLVLVIGLINPTFFIWQTWQNVLMQVSNVGIIAIGAMLVLTSGGLDFTAGDGVSLAGVFDATIFVASNMSKYGSYFSGRCNGRRNGRNERPYNYQDEDTAFYYNVIYDDDNKRFFAFYIRGHAYTYGC